MNLDELKLSRDQAEQQFNNLSNPEWVVNQLKMLRARFDLYNELINKLESESPHATSPINTRGQKSSKNSDN